MPSPYLGLAGTTVGAYLLSQGKMTIGAIVLFLFVIVDAFDGTMARLRGESSDFGAFVDSVSDRYAEFITFGGLLYYFLSQENYPGVMVTFAATAGSVLGLLRQSPRRGIGLHRQSGHSHACGTLHCFDSPACFSISLFSPLPSSLCLAISRPCNALPMSACRDMNA